MGPFVAAVLSTLVALVEAAVHPYAEAQSPPRMSRVGFLSSGLPAPHVFRDDLQQLGYVEGRNLVIISRSLERHGPRLPELAAELIGLKVDVIVTADTAAIHAASQATNRIPIVVLSVGDPVEAGLASSLARPGGNVTGVSGLATGVTTKLLQLLRDAVPGLTRVAILGASAVITRQTPDLEARAREAGLQLRFFEVRTPSEIEPAIEAAARQGAGGLLILPVQFLAVEERRLAHLAVKTRMPTVFWRRSFAEAGGLMAYGPDLYDLWHRLARQVDKVLKGTRPGDIPIEQASKFQLVVNLRTAEQIGLTIPPALLIQADHVIR